MGIDGGTPTARRLGTALLVPALVSALVSALAACTSDPSGSRQPTPVPSSIPVRAAQPHAAGPFAIQLQVGLAVMTVDRCDAGNPRRVCSPDGSRSWAPLGPITPATVADVRTHLADRHTSWTTVVSFTDADRPALRRDSRRATAVGGVVLVLDTDRRVLAAVPASTIHAADAVMTDLDKPAAWGLVEGFEGD